MTRVHQHQGTQRAPCTRSAGGTARQHAPASAMYPWCGMPTAAASAALAAAAAAAPELPWDFLAAAPRIISLEVASSQLGELLAGHPSTPGAGPPVAAAAAAAGAARPGIFTTLAQLRRLDVSGICRHAHLEHLGQLLGTCTQLTQLVLQGDCCLSQKTGDLLLKGLAAAQPLPVAAADGAQPPAAAAAGAAAATAAGAAAAAAATGESAAWRLPPIQHLEVSQPCVGVVDALLSLPRAAAQLTALHLKSGGAAGLQGIHLKDCSGLQALVVDSCAFDPDLAGSSADLGQSLAHLTALTKLVLSRCQLTALPDSLWCLTALRHLSVADNRELVTLPSDLSSLQQLQVLNLSHTGLRELPRELGTWLPQLQDLKLDGTFWVRFVPPRLSLLTRLAASYCHIRRVSGIQHLVGLKELELDPTLLQLPFQQLSRLSALETLSLRWHHPPVSRAAINLDGFWPRLRSLELYGASLELLSALPGVAGMAQLTHLSIDATPPSHGEAVARLGVLPELARVSLCTSKDDTTSWAAAAAWLQQQPKLIDLWLFGGVADAPALEQLPAQLEVLQLSWASIPGGQLGTLTHLSRLRRLELPKQVVCLPPWLSRLSRLEVLDMACYQIEGSGEVLAEMPRLRRVVGGLHYCAHAMANVSHLCWSE